MIPILSTLVLYAGFYLLYNTSRRAELRTSRLRHSIVANRTLSRSIAAILLVISFALFAFSFGPASGVFVFTTMLMSIACLQILLAPLRLIKKS